MKPFARSLSGLLDFECAARWSSFRLAALERHKTPAAISQQIKLLERSLGFQLFARHPRHVEVTEKGRELAGTVTRLLKELNLKAAALREGDDEMVLRISATHSFAIKWLVPRLHRFTQRHPQFDIRVESSDLLSDPDEGSCDVAVRYTRTAVGHAAELLYQERWVVVASPQLGLPPTLQASALLAVIAQYPLLYEETPEQWLRLFEANDMPARRCNFARGYSHTGLLVQAAVAGQGVALVPYSLAAEDLEQGRLVLCPCRPLASSYGYHLLQAGAKQAMPKLQRFSAWMREEVADMERGFEQLVGIAR